MMSCSDKNPIFLVKSVSLAAFIDEDRQKFNTAACKDVWTGLVNHVIEITEIKIIL